MVPSIAMTVSVIPLIMIKKTAGQMRQKLVNTVTQVRDAEDFFLPQGKENIQACVHTYASG